MNPELTEDDVARTEAELEEDEVRDALTRQYFAVDEYGRRLMGDRAYARRFDTALQAALDLKRSVEGLGPIGSVYSPPRVATNAERAEWERLYFAVNDKGDRLMSVDREHRRKVEALSAKIFGTARRDTTGRIRG